MDRQNEWISIREQTDACTEFHREENGEEEKVELVSDKHLEFIGAERCF